MRTARSLIIYREQSGRESLRSLFSQDLRKFEEDDDGTAGNGSKGLKRRRSCHGASERARLTRDGNAGEKEKTRVDEPNLLVEAESDVIRKMDLLSFFDSLSFFIP